MDTRCEWCGDRVSYPALYCSGSCAEQFEEAYESYLDALADEESREV